MPYHEKRSSGTPSITYLKGYSHTILRLLVPLSEDKDSPSSSEGGSSSSITGDSSTSSSSSSLDHRRSEAIRGSLVTTAEVYRRSRAFMEAVHVRLHPDNLWDTYCLSIPLPLHPS